MSRVEYINDTLNKLKYIKIDEYCGFDIYQHKTPTGYFVHQDYMIKNEKLMLVINSYNNYCMEEIFDLIDYYVINDAFGVNVMKGEECVYFLHPNGNIHI